MDINALRQLIAKRDSNSILETVDVHTGRRSVLKEVDFVIEAPNWTKDGRYLVYNSRGHMYTYELANGEIREMDTGFAIDCNNDHVLSPDNARIAVSHFQKALSYYDEKSPERRVIQKEINDLESPRKDPGKQKGGEDSRR